MATPTDDLTTDLLQLAREWEKLGIDPDDFCRCSVCHRILPSCAFDEDAPETICKCGELN